MKMVKTLLTALVALFVSLSANANPTTQQERAEALAAEYNRMVAAGEITPEQPGVKMTTVHQDRIEAASLEAAEAEEERAFLAHVENAFIKKCYESGHIIENNVNLAQLESAKKRSRKLAKATRMYEGMADAHYEKFNNAANRGNINYNTFYGSAAPSSRAVNAAGDMQAAEAGVVRNLERMDRASAKEYKFDSTELIKIVARLQAGKLNYGNVNERIGYLFDKRPSVAKSYCENSAKSALAQINLAY